MKCLILLTSLLVGCTLIYTNSGDVSVDVEIDNAVRGEANAQTRTDESERN